MSNRKFNSYMVKFRLVNDGCVLYISLFYSVLR